MNTTVEVYLARRAGKRIRYRRIRQALDSQRIDPDRIAARMVPRREEPDVPVYLHSTSWRYERGRIVLTYIAYSDFYENYNRWSSVGIERLDGNGSSAARETPREAVLAHCLRHVSYLLRHDPEIQESPAIKTETMAELRSVATQPAGKVAENGAPKRASRSRRHK